MNMKKKRKKVKKYAVGGDLRGQQPESAMALAFRPGGGGDDGSATGQVRAISKAANRAGDYLSTAGKAIGSGSQRGVLDQLRDTPVIRPLAPPPFGLDDGQSSDLKKGGKVKRYAKGKKVKLDTTQYDNQNMMEFDGITVPEGATEEDSKSKKKKKKKPVKKNMGGMMKYKTGGKVTQPRGVGRAVQKKIRPATMSRMKGS